MKIQIEVKVERNNFHIDTLSDTLSYMKCNRCNIRKCAYPCNNICAILYIFYIAMIDELEIRVSRDVGSKLTGGITNFSIETSTRACVYHYTDERVLTFTRKSFRRSVIFAICTDINCFDHETE